MSMNDPIASVLSRIKNAERLNKRSFTTTSNSRIVKQVLSIMQEEGYLEGFTENEDTKGNTLTISMKGRINNTGVIKPRFMVQKDNYEMFEKRYLPARGFGVLIITTNQGLMTHKKAKELGIGGKLIAYCY